MANPMIPKDIKYPWVKHATFGNKYVILIIEHANSTNKPETSFIFSKVSYLLVEFACSIIKIHYYKNRLS